MITSGGVMCNQSWPKMVTALRPNSKRNFNFYLPRIIRQVDRPVLFNLRHNEANDQFFRLVRIAARRWRWLTAFFSPTPTCWSVQSEQRVIGWTSRGRPKRSRSASREAISSPSGAACACFGPEPVRLRQPQAKENSPGALFRYRSVHLTVGGGFFIRQIIFRPAWNVPPACDCRAFIDAAIESAQSNHFISWLTSRTTRLLSWNRFLSGKPFNWTRKANFSWKFSFSNCLNLW